MGAARSGSGARTCDQARVRFRVFAVFRRVDFFVLVLRFAVVFRVLFLFRRTRSGNALAPVSRFHSS